VEVLNGLAPTLEETIEIIQDFIGELSAAALEAKTPPVAPAADLNASLKELLTALDSDDPNCIEPLLPALMGALPHESLEKIESAIEAFDFRGAQALVSAAIALLNTNEVN
jgi:hypothetical protein